MSAFALCSDYACRRPILLPLHRRPRRVSTLHAGGLLSPRPARRQIRRRNPHDRAPRPPRRRLRHLGDPPPRNPPTPRCGAYFVDLDFPAPPPDRPTEGLRRLRLVNGGDV